ncbi:MAG: CUAEP/CCAEP-tail radical SAM (seleno)protein [Acidimicrobiia bacterium]
MRVLLVSTYELGRQPINVASPAAALLGAGHEVRCIDLAVESWDPRRLAWAEAVAFSVPMHTAMRLAMGVARMVRRERPTLPICFYGLYAPVSRDLTVGMLADRVIAGEYEPGLVGWVGDLVAGVDRSNGPADPVILLGRGGFRVPARHLLPSLENYARLRIDGEERLAGSVEASHGCSHRCLHCPVPAIYAGRIRIVPLEVLLADVDRLVAEGARHITFGDPDFLNAPHHSMRVVRAVRSEFPEITFDVTVKVEHVLEHGDLWVELAASGCLFVVSAFETTNDAILARLDKGHTVSEAAEAVTLLRGSGVEVRPSFLPFTPWTSRDDLVEILSFVVDQDLVANVDAVQYAIRLLIPEGSLLLSQGDLAPLLGAYDPEQLSYPWVSPDPGVDALSARLAELVERGVAEEQSEEESFASIVEVVLAGAGRASSRDRLRAPISTRVAPRLTESWFCCAEPTVAQAARLSPAPVVP